MSKEGSLYGKDNWLHGWIGGDISFLDMNVMEDILTKYYTSSEKWVQIYLSKFSYQVAHQKEKSEIAHDISLKSLFEVAVNISKGKYEEQGKIEAYIRAIIENKVKRFVGLKAHHVNYDNPEVLEAHIKDDSDDVKDKIEVEDFMKECEEEIHNSRIDHAINNLDLLFKQKYEDQSIEALAAIEKTSEGGIKSRLRLARKMLMDCINRKKSLYA